MNEAADPARVAPQMDADIDRLAGSIFLQEAAFGQTYNSVRGAMAGPDLWEILTARVGREKPGLAQLELRRLLFKEALTQAQRHNFYSLLVTRIALAQAEQTGDVARASSIIANAGDISGVMPGAEMTNRAKGVMHAIANPKKGLMDARVILDLADAYRAVALIRKAGAGIGTGFLVRPDLLLTSAHVVMEATGDAAEPYRLKEGLSVEFPHAVESKSDEPRTTVLAAKNPIIFAPPHGNPPVLSDIMDAAAKKNLDFALLRLGRRFDDIKPLAILEPPAPEPPRTCFVIGFPGGTASKFDADQIKRLLDDGDRVIHLMNSIEGMSGSPCIGHLGQVIGLHEGGITIGEVVENRAIQLRRIRERIRNEVKPDPLTAKPKASSFAIDDPALRSQWAKAGLDLAGAAGEKQWRDLLADLGEPAPDSAGPWESFHPLFVRPFLEDWCKKAKAPNAFRRVLFVNGDPGVGKSFCIDILTTLLENPLGSLVTLSSTAATSWRWKDAISTLAGVPMSGGGMRPAAGEVKLDTVPDALEALRRRRSVDRQDDLEPLFVAVDFGRGDPLGIEEPNWLQFLFEAVNQPWMRLLILGLHDVPRQKFVETIDKQGLNVGYKEEPLEHVGLDELTDCAVAMLNDRGMVDKVKTVVGHIKKQWASENRMFKSAPNMQTVEATSLMIALHKQRDQV